MIPLVGLEFLKGSINIEKIPFTELFSTFPKT